MELRLCSKCGRRMLHKYVQVIVQSFQPGARHEGTVYDYCMNCYVEMLEPHVKASRQVEAQVWALHRDVAERQETPFPTILEPLDIIEDRTPEQLERDTDVYPAPALRPDVPLE